MQIVDELTSIGRRFTHPETGEIEFAAGEALSDAYWYALENGPSSVAEDLFAKYLRRSLNNRVRPLPRSFLEDD